MLLLLFTCGRILVVLTVVVIVVLLLLLLLLLLMFLLLLLGARCLVPPVGIVIVVIAVVVLGVWGVGRGAWCLVLGACLCEELHCWCGVFRFACTRFIPLYLLQKHSKTLGSVSEETKSRRPQMTQVCKYKKTAEMGRSRLP